MAKQLIFDDEARRKIKSGLSQLAKAVKVTRSALVNAASVSSMLLTTSCAIAEVLDAEEKNV